MTTDGAADVSPPAIVREINAVPDPLLMALVHTVGQSDAYEVGLTLHVSGVIVAGILVAGSRFFNELAELLEERGFRDFADSFARTAAELAREEVETAETDDEDAEGYEPSFIHLRAARVLTTGTGHWLPETLWRGRLSHVSAWSIGTPEIAR